MYYCKKCGTALEDGVKECHMCHTAVDIAPVNDPIPNQNVREYNNVNDDTQTVNYPKAVSAFVMSIIAIVLMPIAMIATAGAAAAASEGISAGGFSVFLFIATLVLSVLGLVFGILSIKFAKKAKSEGKKAPKSLVFGIISVVLSAQTVLVMLMTMPALVAVLSL